MGRSCDVGKSQTFSPSSAALQLLGSTTLGALEQPGPVRVCCRQRVCSCTATQASASWLRDGGWTEHEHRRRLVRSWQRRSSHLRPGCVLISRWRFWFFLSRGVQSAVSGKHTSIRVICSAQQSSLLDISKKNCLNDFSDLLPSY